MPTLFERFPCALASVALAMTAWAVAPDASESAGTGMTDPLPVHRTPVALVPAPWGRARFLGPSPAETGLVRPPDMDGVGLPPAAAAGLIVPPALSGPMAVVASIEGGDPGRPPAEDAGGIETSVHYIPPVEAPVTDPFRPPAGPYGPGNRGIEYATTPGTDVVAAADGVVTFAGAVAGSLFVTVRHADGIRTTVSYVGSALVTAGQTVVQVEVIAIAGPVTHVSARRGEEYLDPSLLWGGPPRVFLVPLDGDAAEGRKGVS